MIILRPATPSDTAFLDSLTAQGKVSERIGRIGGPLAPPQFLRVVVADGANSGAVAVVRSGAGDGGEFELLCVIDERLQSRGIGLAACRLAITEFRDSAAATRLLASVAPDNHGGARLAAALQFTQLGERRINGDILYALSLD